MKKMKKNKFVKYFESKVNEDADVMEIENYEELCDKYIACHKDEIESEINSMLNEYFDGYYCEFRWELCSYDNFCFNVDFFDDEDEIIESYQIRDLIVEEYGEYIDVDNETYNIVRKYYPTAPYTIYA